MRTILWYLPPDGRAEEQEVTLEEIADAGFKPLVEFWNEKAINYPQQTLRRFYNEVAEKIARHQGEPNESTTYRTIVREVQDITVNYFPSRTGSYQYSLVLLGPQSKQNVVVVCRDF